MRILIVAAMIAATMTSTADALGSRPGFMCDLGSLGACRLRWETDFYNREKACRPGDFICRDKARAFMSRAWDYCYDQFCSGPK